MSEEQTLQRNRANTSAEEPARSSPSILGLRYASKGELIDRLKTGLPLEVFYRLQHTLDVPARDLYPLVHIPQRTLYRRRSEGRLTPDESERVLRLAFLYETAERVLQGRDRALHWLKKPHRALAGRPPLQYADTEFGAREVEDLLGRIEHGIPF